MVGNVEIDEIVVIRQSRHQEVDEGGVGGCLVGIEANSSVLSLQEQHSLSSESLTSEVHSLVVLHIN